MRRAQRPLVGSASALATLSFLGVSLHVSTLANASSFPCSLPFPPEFCSTVGGRVNILFFFF